jgi:hypothetical protein
MERRRHGGLGVGARTEQSERQATEFLEMDCAGGRDAMGSVLRDEGEGCRCCDGLAGGGGEVQDGIRCER